MKFEFLAFALAVMMAGIASAHLLVPATGEAGASNSKVQSQRPRTAVPPTVAALPIQSAPLAAEAGRPPVPILFTDRRAIALAEGRVWETLSRGNDVAPPGRITEMAAKSAMEADGYTGVRGLSRGPDGKWKATALRGEVEVQLSVGSTGDVSAN